MPDIDWNLLRDKAIQAAAGAYAPYSQFPVGAASLVDDGRVVTGCNVENVSYGLGLCAECGVVSALHTTGGGRLIALVCVDSQGALLMPCGRCRQVLLEHGGRDLLIDHPAGPRRLEDLLPDLSTPTTLPGNVLTDFAFDAPTVIRTKRDGGRLSDAAIDWVVDAYTDGRVADEQMAALLMAIFWRGMDRREVARWTSAMVASGDRLDFSDLRAGVGRWPRWTSTPPVGSETKPRWRWCPSSPPVAPRSPRSSGRGLGHTGGTLDKLACIAGFTAEITIAQVRQQLCDIGAAIFAAGELAAADKKLYALRDITATVESLPLIATSVMSKKLAEGVGALVLDVKVGARGVSASRRRSAANWPTSMVGLGAAHGVPTRALLTDMDCPLGATVGNAIEVAEALDVLAGGGPPDVVELVRLAAEMLELAGIDGRDPGQTLRRRHRDGPIPPAGRRSGWRLVGTVANRCTFGDRDRRAERHNGKHRRDGSGADSLATRCG